MLHSLQMGLSEKDIEIERLKITVVSLNTKCSVVDDHIEDLKNTSVRLGQSENMREKLQNHIVDASKKILNDNLSHTDYQTELTNEIEALKKQLQQQKKEQFEMEQQKDLECEEVR
jgi:predicted  nucleic acid-binding Zn-ribbon protein